MASPESGALGALYKSMAERMAANPDMDLVSLRSLFEDLGGLATEPEDVTYAEADEGTVRGLFCIPLGADHTRVILYFHGGGFVGNSVASHRKLTGHLAKATGVRLFSVDYRLAPENPYPAQLEDGVGAYEWLVAQGVQPEYIAFAGDSAGGNLAISLALKLRTLHQPGPAAIVAFSPWVDMQHLGKTLDTNAQTDALVSRQVVEGMSAMFLGAAGDPTDPLANPLHADFAGLPPLFLTAGEFETLLNDSERLADIAEAAGVPVRLLTYPGQQHVFPYMAGRAPEADDAIAKAAGWLRTSLKMA